MKAGVAVRWGNTQGEQLHSKMLLLERADGTGFLLLGSANFTRRNLDDYNLELDVAVRGPATISCLSGHAATLISCGAIRDSEYAALLTGVMPTTPCCAESSVAGRR